VKSIYRDEFALFTQLLRDLRQEAGHTQISIAATLGRPQNVISTIERGKLRLDFLQLRDWCLACNTTVVALASLFEERLAAQEAASASTQRKVPAKKRPGGGSAPSAAKRVAKTATKVVKSKP
jgi:transcriptional regulator with XRE-family HTH domain